MLNLITIGDVVIDTHVQIDDNNSDCELKEKDFCLTYGAKIPILNSFQSLGGNAANVAIGAVKMGMSSSIVTTLGADANGEMARQELQKHGVNPDLISYDKKSKTRYSIVLNYKQDRTILSYSDKKKYAWPDSLSSADWIYYTAHGDGFENLQTTFLKYLTDHPTVRLAFNPGSYMLKYAADSLKEIIKRTDVLIVNLEEALRILGSSFSEEKNVPAVIHGLIGLGAKEVALTDAERGAWAGNADEIWHVDCYPVSVLSKTGAGDAFSAGYLAAHFYGHDIPHSLEWGIANSAGVIQKHGPHEGLLDKNGIKKMMASHASIKPKRLF